MREMTREELAGPVDGHLKHRWFAGGEQARFGDEVAQVTFTWIAGDAESADYMVALDIDPENREARHGLLVELDASS